MQRKERILVSQFHKMLDPTQQDQDKTVILKTSAPSSLVMTVHLTKAFFTLFSLWTSEWEAVSKLGNIKPGIALYQLYLCTCLRLRRPGLRLSSS